MRLEESKYSRGKYHWKPEELFSSPTVYSCTAEGVNLRYFRSLIDGRVRYNLEYDDGRNRFSLEWKAGGVSKISRAKLGLLRGHTSAVGNHCSGLPQGLRVEGTRQLNKLLGRLHRSPGESHDPEFLARTRNRVS
jgi:hypothetical protein